MLVNGAGSNGGSAFRQCARVRLAHCRPLWRREKCVLAMLSERLQLQGDSLPGGIPMAKKPARKTAAKAKPAAKAKVTKKAARKK